MIPFDPYFVHAVDSGVWFMLVPQDCEFWGAPINKKISKNALFGYTVRVTGYSQQKIRLGMRKSCFKPHVGHEEGYHSIFYLQKPIRPWWMVYAKTLGLEFCNKRAAREGRNILYSTKCLVLICTGNLCTLQRESQIKYILSLRVGIQPCILLNCLMCWPCMQFLKFWGLA